MICSERLVKEHVMAKDKYTSIILSQLETIVYIYIYIHPNIFCTARDVSDQKHFLSTWNVDFPVICGKVYEQTC